MKKCSFYTANNFYHNNRIFDSADFLANRDNCLQPIISLKKKLEEIGFHVATNDIISPEQADIVILFDLPTCLPRDFPKDRTILVLQECEVIAPQNWLKENLFGFAAVLTWNPDFLAEGGVYHYFWPQVEPQLGIVSGQKRYLCGLVASNKYSDHPLELYSARRELINWFEKNYSFDFGFFGMGWNKIHFFRSCRNYLCAKFMRKLAQFADRFAIFRKVFVTKYACYGGAPTSKFDALQSMRFTICYENARDIPGYVTEKIFDSFFARSVPVYWGAPDISDYIPENCFIDRRKFVSNEDLYKTLKSMSEGQYQMYLSAIEQFLASKDFEKFKIDSYVNQFVLVVNHLEKSRYG